MENNNNSMVVVGLGYVGLPLAMSFSEKMTVIGYDNSIKRVQELKQNIDLTNEVESEKLAKTSIIFTNDEKQISNAKYIIVTVPTPVDENNDPDLNNIVNATMSIGRNMQKGCIVIYESTVYPGLTEEICVPLLEQYSKMKCGIDFKVGYSPERANPGDKVHCFYNTAKVVSGIDKQTADELVELYSKVINAQIYKAKSIKVAEASKVIENTQRDVNIAFINEVSIVLDRLGIDTNEVLEAARTKWNFLDFKPGLVGGHCIGVDPYYLSYKAKQVGIQTNIINASRKTNNYMTDYISQKIISKLEEKNKKLDDTKVIFKGITFKENVPDIRNSKPIEIIKNLESKGIKVVAEDEYANKEDVKKYYGISLTSGGKDVDAVVFAVPHDKYKNMSTKDIKSLLKEDDNLVFDIKGMYNKQELLNDGIDVWRL